MAITQAADTSAAYAGLRVGPGITLGFYRSGATPAGSHLSVTILYTFGGSPWSVCFGTGFATAGSGQLSFAKFYGGGTGLQNLGVPDGAAVSVVVIYTDATGTFLETATFTGYSWDAVTGLQNLLQGGSDSVFGQILAAVRRTYSSP